MKVDVIIGVTGGLGAAFAVGCLVCPHFHPGLDGWNIFCTVETVLGYIANLAIVAAAIRFCTSKKLHIKGIGKVKINRTNDNIQDLTNLISSQLFDGENFRRAPVLEAFYADNQMKVLETDPEYEKYRDQSSRLCLTINGKEWTVRRSSVRSVEALMEAVKWIHFDGQEIDPATRKEIYTEWYKVD